ncbi:MAG: hypothetical protein ACK4MM_04165, partial [Fervidobacterium sp.]
FTQATIGTVEDLKGFYNGSNLKLTWSYSQSADKFKVYKKLSTDNDFVFASETTNNQIIIQVPESEYNSLEKVAVSVVYQSSEGEKVELIKENILPFDGGTGTEQDPYVISTAWQLQILKNNPWRTGNYSYKLANDIDLAGLQWNPIGQYSSDNSLSFKGKFDGNGKKILNLSINNETSSNIGLFGYITNAVVSNLIIENAFVVGKTYVGALSGGSKDSQVTNVAVINSYVEAKDTASSNYAGGLIGDINIGNSVSKSFVINTKVKGAKDRIGGFAGRIYGTSTSPTNISNCYVKAIDTTNYQVEGAAGSTINAGGFVGYYNIASGAGGVTNCYSAIKVVNGGGFAGNAASSGKSGASSVYYDQDVAGTTTDALGLSYGVTPKTTTEMKQRSTYQGWDFDNVWNINDGNDYPYLRWFGN